ncbi:polysaccharide deacetylase family protein [Pedobacter sp. NJ-S-72]
MVLLSFDIEEFDMAFEYGKSITFEDQISISTEGTRIILDLLLKNNLKATFFSTVTFAKNATHLIKRILDEGHELASHGVYHSDFKKEHLLESRLALEELSGVKVAGYRMARMMPVG